MRACLPAGNDLAKLAWAMAKVQHLDVPLLNAIAERVVTVCSKVLPLEDQGEYVHAYLCIDTCKCVCVFVCVCTCTFTWLKR